MYYDYGPNKKNNVFLIAPDFQLNSMILYHFLLISSLTALYTFIFFYCLIFGLISFPYIYLVIGGDWLVNYQLFKHMFLEVQLLSNLIDVTDSLTGRLALSTISPMVVDLLGRSLLFCHLEFDKEAISDSVHGTFPCF